MFSNNKNIIVSCLLLVVLNNIAQTATTTLVTTSQQVPASYVSRDQIKATVGSKFTPNTRLYLDKEIIAPTAYAASGTNGINPVIQTLNLTKPVGSIPYTFNVTPVGSAACNVPIYIPTGTANMQPNISLAYSSVSVAGIAGIGWNISGISSIFRTNSTFYNRGFHHGVDLTSDDLFSLDGNRLVWSSGYGGNGAINVSYSTESESFRKISSKNTIGNGPEWFQVETKDGITYEYGNSVDSRLIPVGQTTVLEWKISKMYDSNGNYILFNYNNVNGEVTIKEILYTGNATAGIVPYNSIKFYYQATQYPNSSFIAGGEVNNSTLLRQIEVKTDSEFTKQYNFNYSQHHADSYLTNIEEVGSDYTTLNPLKFSYGIDNSVSLVQDIIKTGSANLPYMQHDILLDFNGDGKKDLVALNYDLDLGTSTTSWFNWEPYKNIGNNTFQSSGNPINFPQGFQPIDIFPVNRGVSGNMLYESIDFNGDSKEDVLMRSIVPVSTTQVNLTFYPYVSNGNSFDPSASISIISNIIAGSNSSLPKYNHWLLDANGDRKIDLMVYIPNATFTEGDLYIYLGLNPLNPIHKLLDNSSPSSPYLSFSSSMQLDIDGDGVSEFVNLLRSNNGVTTKHILKFINGNPYVLADLSNTPYLSNNYFVCESCPELNMDNPFNLYADFNGDGKTDYLNHFQTNLTSAQWKIYLSKGNSNYKPIDISTVGLPVSTEYKYYLCRDVSGDGKADILEFNELETTNNLTVYYSTGLTFLPESYTVDMTNFTQKIRDLNFGDFNGDGIEDLYIGKNPGGGEVSGKIFYFNRGAKSKRLTQMYDGIGKYTQFNFTPLTAGSPLYTKSAILTYPLSQFQNAFYVVSETKTSNGIGGLNSTTYAYEDAILHLQGKGLLGFKKITAIDVTQDLKSVANYNYNTPYFNLFPVSTKLYINSTSVPLSTTNYVNSNIPISSFDGPRYFNKIDNITKIDHLSGNVTSVDNVYNTNGNLTSQTTNVNAGYEITNKTLTYTQAGAWLPNKVSSNVTTVTRNGETPYSRRVDYQYNAKGNLIKQTNDVNSLINSTVIDYVIDANTGLSTQQTLSSTALTPKLTHWDYDAKFRFKIKSYNVLNQASQVTYDNKWAKPITVKGIDGLTSTYTYDGFGNPIYSKTPDGIESNSLLEWAQPADVTGTEPLSIANILYKITKTQTGSPTTVSYYDMLARELKSQVAGFTNPVFKVAKYDAKGRLEKSSSNYQTNIGNTYIPVINTYYYDAYNRNIQGNVSDGTNLFNTYYGYTYVGGNSKTTTTTPDGKTVSKTTDPTGILVEATDNGGTILTSYYSNHKPKEVKVNGVTMNTMEYDDVANQTKLVDKSAGTTTFVYDAFGLLKSTTDANNKTHTFEYDNIDRPISKTNSMGVTSYQYITSGGGLNQLLQVTAPNGITQAFTYDNLNRTKTVTENINGNNFTTAFDYDQNTNVSKITYPTGFAIKKEYTTNGYLKTVKRVDNSVLIWEQDDVNPMGQVTKFTNGNGIQTIKTFNNIGTLTNITAGTIQNLSLNFNLQNGNLLSRTDNLKGLAENFTYDNLDRLTQSNVAGTTNQINITYGNVGNILDKTDVGTTTFNASKTNALETATNPTPDISLLQQDITYTPFNKVQSIIEGDNQYTIIYGADDERKKTETYFQSNLINTKYYVANFEKEITPTNTREVHYIAGTNAVYVIDNGVGNMYYLYTDHLGTINTITNDAGTVVLEQNFDAWGRKRNHTNWTYTANNQYQAFNWFARGYTGHEHLTQFGLINMNGRMYDPITSQMLSPDPFNQNPNFTQNYNRYTYAYGNPLKYSDPTGYLTWTDVVAGVSIVVGIVLAATGVGGLLGAGLIIAGGGHFLKTLEIYQHGGTWNDASNWAGYNLTIYADINSGSNKKDAPIDFGITEYDNALANQASQGNDPDFNNGGASYSFYDNGGPLYASNGNGPSKNPHLTPGPATNTLPSKYPATGAIYQDYTIEKIFVPASTLTKSLIYNTSGSSNVFGIDKFLMYIDRSKPSSYQRNIGTVNYSKSIKWWNPATNKWVHVFDW